MRVRAQALAPIFRSKTDLYKMLTQHLQYYLPPISACTIDFLKDVLNGKKKVIRRVNLKTRSVPRYKELSASYVFGKIISLYTDMMDYFPDFIDEFKPNRDFFWNIFNTIHHEAV